MKPNETSRTALIIARQRAAHQVVLRQKLDVSVAADGSMTCGPDQPRYEIS